MNSIKSKFEKLMIGIPIAIAFIIMAIFIFTIMGYFTLNRWIVDVLLVLGILCVGCITCLQPIKILTYEKDKKVLGYISLISTALTCLLWIIFVFVGQSFIFGLIEGTDPNLASMWGYSKVAIFVTIQTAIINMIISTMYVFKKSYMPFQIVMYISNIIMDLWLTILILSTYIDEYNSLAIGSDWLFSKIVLTFAILAFTYSVLAGSIMKVIMKRKAREMAVELNNTAVNLSNNGEQKNTLEERLNNLKNLKESGAITEEEYNEKKAKILDEI